MKFLLCDTLETAYFKDGLAFSKFNLELSYKKSVINKLFNLCLK
jgi:hypothetical protein